MIGFHHILKHLDEIESSINLHDRKSAFTQLRKFGLNDFLCVLWSMPDPRYPKLSSLLPKMAPLEIQKAWTGSSGSVLLNQTISFTRSVAANYASLSGSSLDAKKVLDFGCGYGRLLRAFSFFTDDLYGVDPWTESVRICHESEMGENVLLSDYLPASLPVQNDFDLVFAFSVFTHLSERATKQCLTTLRSHMKIGAILCLTIRPVEYWRLVYRDSPEEFLSNIEREHQDRGFAFIPHHREAVDGDITYGDTSMTLDYLTSIADGFAFAAMDRSGDDEVQRYVFLKAQ